jgi:hypothetical protein
MQSERQMEKHEVLVRRLNATQFLSMTLFAVVI